MNYYVNGQRGNLRWDNINALDLSVDYRLRLGRAELFVQPQVLNVFNQAAQINGNTTVTEITPFNPFTTSNPTQCPAGQSSSQCAAGGYNYRLSANFGKARTPSDYALMRTYRVSFGVRF